MESSDLHLERALEEYNGRVNDLEPSGPSEELMEAYVNRGCILQMMDYRTSAMDDLQQASDILDLLESQGSKMDPGTYVRIHTAIGAILFDQGADASEEYARALSRLSKVNESSRHFDRRSLVRMCAEASENLLDSEYPEDVEPFARKGLDACSRSRDAWSENRRMELLGLLAEACSDMGLVQDSVSKYGEAIDIGMDLMGRGALEDPEQLVMYLVMRAEGEESLGLMEMHVADLRAAVTMLEEMLRIDRLEDPEVLVSLHHDLAGSLIKMGRIKEAESHLIKAMQIGVRGAGEYMESHTRPRRARNRIKA